VKPGELTALVTIYSTGLSYCNSSRSCCNEEKMLATKEQLSFSKKQGTSYVYLLNVQDCN